MKKQSSDLNEFGKLFSDKFTPIKIFESIFNNISDGICVFELKDKPYTIYCNKIFYKNVGISEDDNADKFNIDNYLYPDYSDQLTRLAAECAKTGKSAAQIVKAHGKNNSAKWYNVKIIPASRINSEYPVVISIVTDITENKQLEQNLSIIHERYRIFEETTSSMLFDYTVLDDTMKFSSNDNGHIEKWEINRYRTSPSLIHPDDRENFNRTLMDACYAPTRGSIEYRTKALDKNKYTWCKAYYSSVTDDSGNIVHVFGRIKNIDVEVNKRNNMLIKAERDHLTSVYNRMAAEEKITERIKENCGGKMFFILIDIDNFKNFNDEYGHIFGDQVLITVAQNIRKLFPDAVAARFGGDEFIVFTDTESEDAVMKKLRKLSADSYCEKDGKIVDITFSVGAAVSDKAIDYISFFSEADSIMYDVKNNGKNNIIMRTVNKDEKSNG
ncbi:MAG: diguanylate cyclase [Clostridium sp.]|nr:diguanylate cyclase [Clostridium sp.]MCM1546849.1 diguanylate cyclase [Ruminococcus sp.]